MYDNARQTAIDEGDGVADTASASEAAERQAAGAVAPADPDLAIILAAGRGDAAAARTLVDRLLPPITGFSARMLGDAAEAEDVAQEVFVKAWRAAAKWQPGRARFSTWLYRVAHNACIDRLRRRPASLAQDFDMADERDGPAEQMEQRQTEAAVRQAVAGLPERQRAALALCYYQGLSNREAANIMEITVEALESLLSRGRRTLRGQMEGASHE